MYYVYLLKSVRSNRHYIGSTDNIDRRVLEHNAGKVRSTKAHCPWRLLGTEIYDTLSEARQREYYLKSLKNPKYVKIIFGDKK